MTTSPSNFKALDTFLNNFKQRLHAYLDKYDDWEIIIPPSEIMAKKQDFPCRVYNKRWLQPSETLPKLMYAIEFTKDHCEDIRMGIVKRDKSIDITALTAPYQLTPETNWWLNGAQESAYFTGNFIERISSESGFIDQFIGQFIGMVDEYELPLLDIHKGASYKSEASYLSPYKIKDDFFCTMQITEIFSDYREIIQPAKVQSMPKTSLSGHDNILHALNQMKVLPMPEIFLSDHIPPLLRRRGFSQDQEDWSYDGWPSDLNGLNIEDLLGCYNPRKKKITLFNKGIHFVSEHLSVCPDTLSTVVLVHEFSHWMMHQEPIAGKTWNTNLYQGSATDLHEGWAQLLTHWLAQQSDDNFKQVFTRLTNCQPQPYHVFKQFTYYSGVEVIKSLKKLRERKVISDTDDWKNAFQKQAW